MEKRRSFVLTVLTAIAISLLLVPAAQSQVIRWRGQSAYSGTMSGKYSSYQNGGNVVEWIRKATGGRLVIDLAQPGQIVPISDMFDAVSKGIIQFAGMHYAGYYAGKFPETDIEVGLPMAWQTVYDAWDAYHRYGLLEEYEKIYAEKNIKYFPTFCDAQYSIGTTFPFSSYKDFKGKKIRGAGIYGEFVATLGAAPVNVPFVEAYMATKLKTIDGGIFGFSIVDDAKMKELWTHWLLDPMPGVANANYLFNMGAWNSLPADIKEMIERDLEKVDIRTTFIENVDRRMQYIDVQKNYRMKMVTLPESEKAELLEKSIMIWNKVAGKSPRCARLVEIVKRQMRDLGRIK